METAKKLQNLKNIDLSKHHNKKHIRRTNYYMETSFWIITYDEWRATFVEPMAVVSLGSLIEIVNQRNLVDNGGIRI